MKNELIIRVWIIILGIFIGFSIFQLYVLKFLESKCIIKTNSCIQIKYQKYENSVLVHMQPSGYWIWFDGANIFIYGEPTGRTCDDEGFEPAYVYNIEKKTTSYMCAKSLEKDKNYYTTNKAPEDYIFLRKDTTNFGVYDMINYLSDKRIININTSEKSKVSSLNKKSTKKVNLSGVLGNWG